MQGEREGEQIEALLRQTILVARWFILIKMLLDDSGRQQQAQSVCEDVSGDAESGIDIVVTMQAKEKRCKQQRRPSIPDRIDGMEHRGIDTFGVARRSRAFASTSRSLGTDRVTGARARCRGNILQSHGLIAMHTGERWFEVVAAAPVSDTRRQTVFASPAMFPAPHAQRHRVKTQPLFGESILETTWGFTVRHPIENAVFNERIETCRERAAGCPGAAPEIFEAADAKECIAQNQKRPAIAEGFKRTSPFTAAQQVADRVDVLWQFTALHGGSQFNTRGVINR